LSHDLAVWLLLLAFVAFTTAGDVLLARAMTRIGDLGELRARVGIAGCVTAVLSSGTFWIAIVNMALSFFSLLTALNWANLSFVGPATSAMAFVANIVAAKVFLKEDVDHRRWIATALVCVGILLIGLDPVR
jgi:multidrug transporter EmrE-like cation transporter